MARKDESILNLVVRLPWRIGVCLAVGTFVFLRYILPFFFSGNSFLKGISEMLSILSPVIGLVLLAAVGVSAFKSMERGQMLEAQKDLDTLKELSWREFEELVGEAFRRRGYFVLENPGAEADGGVDLRLRKDGQKIYVQCKHWKTRRVGVSVVRELYGVISDKGADEGIVVTYGRFTPEAVSFASDKPIRLIGGERLIKMIREIQRNPQIRVPRKQEAKICPACGSEMVVRVARKGKYTGQKFWGCSRFPECRAKVKYVENGRDASLAGDSAVGPAKKLNEV
jgi:restriction system protein